MRSILPLLALVAVCTARHVTVSKCCPHGYGVQGDGFLCAEYHVSDADVSWLPREAASTIPDNTTIFTIVPKMHHELEFKFEPCPQTDVDLGDLFISQESSEKLLILPNGTLITSDETSESFASAAWCVDRAISYDGEQTGIQVLSCSSMKARIPVCCKNSDQVDNRRMWMECMTDLSEENEIVPEPFSCESPAYREHGVVQSVLATTGSIFSLLTLAIHADSPRLRCGLKGFSLMSHCACMLAAHVFLAFRPFAHNWGAGACVTVATITQFTLLAAFFWINVRAIIIHSKYRSLSAMLGKAKGLVWYILYAFGVPLFISVLTLWAQISQNRPNWIIWPHIHHDTCWFGSAAGRGAYFSAPMGGVLLLSLALFFTAAHKVVRMRRDTAMYLQADPLHKARSKRADFRRLKLYLKLYVLMGLTFSAELLAWVGYLLSYYWYTSGIFIVLRAVLIFVIFCCSSKIWVELLQRHPRLRKVLLSCKVHRIAGDAIFYVDQDKIEFSQTSTSVSRRNGHLYSVTKSVADEDMVDHEVTPEGTQSELVELRVPELFHQKQRKSGVVGRNYHELQTSDDPNNVTNSQSDEESCTESEQDLQEINLNEDGTQDAETLQDTSRFRRVINVCAHHISRIKHHFTSS